MSILSNGALNLARDILETALPDTCNILSVSLASDGQGGQVETWGTATASVACRLDPERGRELQAGGAVQSFNTYVLTMPYDTTVTSANRIEHGSYTYSIHSVDYDKSWPIDIRCQLERI